MTIAEAMNEMSDQDLIDILPYLRNEDGDHFVSLVEIRHCIRETLKQLHQKETEGQPR